MCRIHQQLSEKEIKELPRYATSGVSIHGLTHSFVERKLNVNV